ncbi:MAG: signal peptidase II [Patescibacteria group bacterium]
MLKFSRNFGKIFWTNFFVLTFFILDRFFKNLFLSQETIYKEFGPFAFFLTKNSRVIFGFFASNIWFDILTGLVLLFVILKLKEAYLKKDFTSLFVYSLLIGGAVSNILDRIKYGFIIDYIDLGPWHIFNLADLLILSGVVILVVQYWRERSKKS